MNKKTRWISVTTLISSLALFSLVALTLGHFTSVQAGSLTASEATEGTKSSVGQINALSASAVQTWTHDTRADWEAGTLDLLDGVTISGSLQLARRSFGANEQVSTNAATKQTTPAIIAHPTQPNTLYIAWADNRSSYRDIYTARSTNSGATWSPGVQVNDDTSKTEQYEPSLDIGADGTLYLAWTDERNGDPDIYFSHSTDGGVTWSANIRSSDNRNMAAQTQPSLIYGDNNTLYLAWRDTRNVSGGDIYFARSSDGGNNWHPGTQVNDFGNRAGLHSPKLSRNHDGTLYLAFSFPAWYNSECYLGNVHVTWSSNGGQTWASGTKVNTTTPLWVTDWDFDNIALATGSGDKLYVAWEGRPCNSGTWGDVYAAYSDDGGLTWSLPTRMGASWVGFSPDLAVDSAGTVYLAWKDYTGSPSWATGTYVARSLDGGTSWSDGVQVDDGNYTSNPDLAISSGGKIHLAWQDNRYDADVYFSHSSDSGLSWSTNLQIDDGPGRGAQWNPNLAIDSAGQLYLAWCDNRDGNENIYSAIHPSGGTWGTNVKINDDAGTAIQSSPAIAADSSGVYAVWGDWRDGNSDIYFAYSPIGGNWGANVKVNDDVGTEGQYSPDIALDGGGDAYTVWVGGPYGDNDIYFAYRPTGGAWGTNVQVNDVSGSASFGGGRPSIAVDSLGNAYAVWQDIRDGQYYDIYFAYRPTGGNWGANVKVNDSNGGAKGPDIAVDSSGNSYAVWYEYRDSSKADIYFAYRPNGGSWGTSVKVNDNTNETQQWRPEIAVDSAGNAFVAWYDDRSNNGDIYFAHRTTGDTWDVNVRVNEDGGIDGGISPLTIAADESGNAHVTWTRAGVIFFTRSISVPQYWYEGDYTSPELDTGVTAASWELLTWQRNMPAGTTLSFETRSRIAGGAWSEWEPASSLIASPSGQYFQYRAAFSTTFTDTTPVLDWVKVAYRSAGTPSAPRFVTPCGVTNQVAPTIRGSAAADSVVYLYVDGAKVATTTASVGGTFSFAHVLSAGGHTLTATAESNQGLGPVSDPLALTISPTLSYDPINVRTGQWSKDGWLMSVPRDANGCANPDNDWRVWPRKDQKFRVQVPVSYTTSAAVTVTIGTRTITLTEESVGLFAGVFQPPIQGGDFIIHVNADGDITTVSGGPVLIDPDGFVYEVGGTISDTIPGVQVTCYYSDTHSGQWVMWDAWNYDDQVNPQITLDDGYYSFYTPPGTYRVVAVKEGYPIYASPDLVVVDIPVRHNVPLGYVAPTVALSGTDMGEININHTFTATVNLTATTPITYVWYVEGKPPLEHVDGELSDTAVFSWTVPGPQRIIVTATNVGGVTTDTHVIVINEPSMPVASITKIVTPTGTVDYGDELTYALVISATPGTQVALYDPLEGTTWLRFVGQEPAGITNADDAITGTLAITPTSQITVSFVVEVGIPGTVGWTVSITNTACAYPIGGTIEDDCIWSNKVVNAAFQPYSIYLPLTLRNY